MDELDKHSSLTIDKQPVKIPDLSVFKTAFDHAADGLLVLNSDRRVLYMNPAAEAMVGITDTIGTHCGTLLHCHDDEHETLRFDACYGLNVLATQQSLTHVEMNIVNSAGEVVPVEVTYSYVPGFDGTEYLLMSLRNVSLRKEMENERRQKEALRYTLQERERLARDLHDGVVQDIAYANMQIKLLIEDFRSGLTPNFDTVEKISSILEESFVELRQAIHDLTFSVKADIHTFIGQYLRDYQLRTGIETHLQCDETPIGIEPFMKSQIAKIIQEALTNIRKHAQASRVRVRMHMMHKDTLSIIVEDDVMGFVVEQRKDDHYGMKTMQERCELIGGKLFIKSKLNQGTAVQIFIPLS